MAVKQCRHNLHVNAQEFGQTEENKGKTAVRANGYGLE